MPLRKEIIKQDGLYFIGFTCYRWLRLLQFTQAHELVYQWFDKLRSAGHRIAGFVIMPNQVFAMIDFLATGKSINTLIGEGKRFIAYGIIERLRNKNEDILLSNLQKAVTPSDRLKGKKHEIWEGSFTWKNCESPDLAYQKLQYIHNQPCAGRWQLAPDATAYEHSSARYYTCKEHSGYEVTDLEVILNGRMSLVAEPAILLK